MLRRGARDAVELRGAESHGANRLGASALMQGLADGYFILPVTVSNFLASQKAGAVDENHAAVRQTVAEVEDRLNRLLAIKGTRTPDSFHRELGALVWDQCGMAASSLDPCVRSSTRPAFSSKKPSSAARSWDR